MTLNQFFYGYQIHKSEQQDLVSHLSSVHHIPKKEREREREKLKSQKISGPGTFTIYNNNK